MLRNTLRRNKGITLIALVVTIIVLLILAGISIAMLTGQNGILNRAAEAKEKTGVAQEDESQKLQGYEDTINQYAPGSNGGSGGGNGGGSSSDLSDFQTNDTKPYLPDATKFEKVAGTDLSTGLVMKEKATGSEYVWVEVPRTTTVYRTAGLNITSFTNDEYTKIENDLHTYTNDYRNGTSYSDVYYPDSTTGWFTETGDTSYDTAKKKMLKSVYQNGGFWVGRYEAGIENEANIRKTESSTATLTPVSKQNAYPYNYVTRTQAKVLAEQVESGSYTSSLMFGVQWDLVLKYIQMKKEATVTDIKTKLNSNSTPIGNYYNSEFTLNRGKFAQYNALSKWYNFNSEEKPTLVTGSKKKEQRSYENGILLTTGATDATGLQNISDIAGNVWEWTLEWTSYGNSPCAGRGGSCFYGGSDVPASGRSTSTTSYSISYIGFRVSLY